MLIVLPLARLKRSQLSQASAVLNVEDGADLPCEFRLFKAGLNETKLGDFYVTPDDAIAILRAYERDGVDLMVDLEHDSIDEDKRALRPDAADARGWFKLSIRNGAEVWAEQVTWCPDGERRLREKTQRYISPVFAHTEDGHVRAIVNVALCARPATIEALPLVAARDREDRIMDPNLIKKLLALIEAGDKDGALAILSEIVASAAGGTPAEPPPAGSALAEGAANPAPAPGEDPATKEDKAVACTLRQLFGKAGNGEALAALRSTLESVNKLNATQAALDHSSRVELVGDLVKLGAELPCTAWDGEPSALKPAQHLLHEDIEHLRARVSKLRAARPKGIEREELPNTQLSAADQARADRITDPTKKAEFIALRLRSYAK